MKAADPQTDVRAAEGARDWSGNERPTERRRGAKRAALPRGDGAGGRELQRKARRPACGARARKSGKRKQFYADLTEVIRDGKAKQKSN